jgi:hypothetical protein
MTTLVQQMAPRKITGARNVTRKPVPRNETIELSRLIPRAPFNVYPESNRVRAYDEMDFRFRSHALA